MKLLGFLIPPWVLPVLAAIALAGAFWGGWKVQGWRCGARQVEALQRAQERFRQQLEKQQNESEAYEQSRERARQDGARRDETIRTVYEDRIVDPGCEPPAGVRSVLQTELDAANARAAGEPAPEMP